MSQRGPDPGMDPAVAPAARPAGAEGVPGYAVKLPAFEGPLDLLLHLIRANEVDVTDIPIARIAEQYVEYLALMRELNLDVAGEYLVMAATLAWIKSRMLLPPSEEEDEEEGLDPRAELVARLLEYQRYKEAAEGLGERSRLGRDVFEVRTPEPEPTPDAEREIEVGLVTLLDAFRRVLQRAKPRAVHHEVEIESVTVAERMRAVMELMRDRDAVEFDRIFELESGAAPSRPMLVTTFLALLELVRLAAVRVYQGLDDQGVPEGPIRLRRTESDADWGARIAEIM